MKKLILQSLLATLVFTVLTGLAYPLVITGIAQLCFHDKANGSLVTRDGQAVGSELLAQKFESPRYFWPRPSASDYATVPSGASNYGPTSAALQKVMQERANKIREAHKLSPEAPIPADLLFASGSGLDPHISPEAARLQVTRIATERGVSAEKISALVEKFIEPPQLGFLGEPRVNVLLLNLALDEGQPK